MKLVEVKWIDSAFNQGWRTASQKVTYSECLTTGYLVEKSARQVVVAMQVNDEGGYSEAMAIPRSCVKSIRKVR